MSELKQFKKWFIEYYEYTDDDDIDFVLELMPKSESGLEIKFAKTFTQGNWAAWQAALEPKWISTEDEKPLLKERVWILDSKNKQWAAKRIGAVLYLIDGLAYKEDVTHWMPLPETAK